MVLQEQSRSIPKSGQNCGIGILVNPRAARDVRRLVTGASSVPVSERIAICYRIVRGLSALDIGQILMMPDRDNIAMKLKTAVERDRSSTSAKLPDSNSRHAGHRFGPGYSRSRSTDGESQGRGYHGPWG